MTDIADWLEHEADEPDEPHIEGLTNASFTITGTWGVQQDLGERDIIFYHDVVRCFGITWWSERSRFRSRSEVTREASGFEIAFRPVTPVTSERSEWWRRCGHTVIRHVRSLAGRIRSGMGG